MSQVVKFEITKLEDSRKDGSEVAVGNVYEGLADGPKILKVYYTDKVGCNWIFYVGDTCKLII